MVNSSIESPLNTIYIHTFEHQIAMKDGSLMRLKWRQGQSQRN